MPNIEIKARLESLSAARECAKRLGARFEGVDHQIDTYFRVPNGRLKLRESSLEGPRLIPYLRADQGGPKKSDYALIRMDAPLGAKSKELLSAILGVETVVEKKREIHHIENVRVHLDDVRGLGAFLEFEAVYADDTPEAAERESARVRELLREFGVAPEALLRGSYREM